MKIKNLLFIIFCGALFGLAGIQNASAATNIICYSNCSPTYTNVVGVYTLDLQCNAASPTSYTAQLTVNGVAGPVNTKYCACTYTGPVGPWAPACYATGTWNTPSGSNATINNTVAGYTGTVVYSCSNGVYSYVSQSCTANSYNYTFNSNGGTPSYTTVNQVSGTTVSSPGTPTRAGYTFAGWSPALPTTMPVGGGGSTAQWTANLPCTYTGTVPWAPACSATGTWNTPSGGFANINNTAVGYNGSIIYSCLNGAYYYVNGLCDINSYTVSATAGAGGTISPASRAVGHGGTTTFTVTPNAGYTASASGCGGSLVGGTYTTGAITGACTVSATFTPKSYTVSTSAVGGGSISPTSIMVSYGSKTNINVTPNIGNTPSVTGCGGSLSGSTYTTGIITGDCTVSATFNTSYTFNSNGGTPSYTTVNQVSGTTVSSPGTPTRAGYTFAGWSPALPIMMPGSGGGSTAQWTANSCTLPWGGTIASGNSATAYQSSSVVSPATCTSQSRTCTNGSLSGTYTNQNCTVTAACPGADVTNGTQSIVSSAAGGTVWGSNPFTTDSTLQTIARFLGVPQGQTATLSITNLDCQPSFTGSTANGVTTSSYSAWKGMNVSCISNCVALPAATISSSPTTCTIASGASTCNIPFTWNITDAASPNLYNSTTANTYSTSASGTSLSYAITNGSNTVQARNSTTVLNSVTVTGSCVAGTAWSGSSCISTNTSTSPTIIINPTTYYSGVSNTYTFTATDPQGDQVRYGIDWNMDGVADDWLPAFPGYVNSGTSRSMSYTWPTTGNKQFQALTQDYQGINSAWTVRNITVTDAPCANNTINPPTCTQCANNIAYANGGCVFCSTGGCTGTPGGNTTNGNNTLTCNSGAINIPNCTVCPGGQTLVGSMCVNNCTNGATNPTACDACPAGQELIGGICTVTTTCGDATCNGSETILTCPADCKMRYQQF